MSYAVFAFTTPAGGWSDHYGTVLTTDAAVTLAQRLHAFAVVQIVDLRTGTVLDVARPDPPTCAHGVPQRWEERADLGRGSLVSDGRWRGGSCAPCLLAESGEAALLSVPGTTPGPTTRFR